MLSKNAEMILHKRYCRNNETPMDVYKRVSETFAMGDEKFKKRLYSAMVNGYFVPASPAIRNAGMKRTLLHPCAVLGIEDTIENIFEAIKKTAILFHYGAGVGINFSKLRPKGFKLSSGGEASGAVSFISLFDRVTEEVKQGGFRKGGVLGVLDCNHPDIYFFITSKLRGGLTNCNLSVLVTDDFMNKVKSEDYFDLSFNGIQYNRVKAKDLFERICFSAHQCGCPGLLFYDRINKDNPYYPQKDIRCGNLCSELPLFEDLMCNLGSLNLSKFIKKNHFDTLKFAQYIELATRTLLNINGCGWYPYHNITENMKKYNPIGVGLAGFADLLIKLGIYYASDDTLKIIDEIKKPYIEITNRLAPNSFYKRSLPPTGTCSILLDCSPAIEPIYDRNYKRFLSFGVIEEKRDIYSSKYAQTAYEISPEWRIKIQSKWQNDVIDSAISSTINLPKETTVEKVKEIYYSAWEAGLKGITIFIDQSKEGGQVYKKITCSDGESCSL